MSASPFRTRPGHAWEVARVELVGDLLALTGGHRYLAEYAIIAVVARFQRACRELFHLTVAELASVVDEPAATIIRTGLIAEHRLARGNATSAALAADFDRVGIDIWALPVPGFADSAAARRALDAVNALRNDLAHGDTDREPPSANLALGIVGQLDALVRAFEAGVVAHLAALRSAHPSGRGGE